MPTGGALHAALPSARKPVLIAGRSRFANRIRGRSMQTTSSEPQSEAEALRDRIWTFSQRGVIMLVFFFAGLFIGYQLWGQATVLQEKVVELTDRTQSLVKERDTERSRITLIERDKKELEQQLNDVRAKLAAAAAKEAQ
jgi:hypothetical protein